jgi:MazG family protein
MSSNGDVGPTGADHTPAPDLGPERLDYGAKEGVLDRALTLVSFLRRHCPWDRAQTAESLIPHLLEETQEVVDAIRSHQASELEGELGDLLLNLAFQIVVGEERGDFTRESVFSSLDEKMRQRHPHLFGLGEKEDWEEMKVRERGEGARVLQGLARGLDPLLRAHRIQDRVSGVGFDWSDPGGAWEKVAEELEEVAAALREGDQVHVEEELGDLLFSAVNLTRLAGAHPHTVLDRANRKFQARFEALEDLAEERGIQLPEASLDVLDGLWEELKARR